MNRLATLSLVSFFSFSFLACAGGATSGGPAPATDAPIASNTAAGSAAPDGGAAPVTAPGSTYKPAWTYSYRPPALARPGACRSDEITSFLSQCMTGATSTDDCVEFVTAHRTCSSCILSDVDDATWGPLVVADDGVLVNQAGCFAAEKHDDACGRKILARAQCMSRCWSAVEGDETSCRMFALDTDCRDEVDMADACIFEHSEKGVLNSRCTPVVDSRHRVTTQMVIEAFCGG